MSQSNPGQMTWKLEGAETSGMLHLRYQETEPWRPYTDFPEHFLPDPPEFSQGYATFLALLKQNWKTI
ncbi:MAG: hypothetical protein QNJ38_19340 [Prochloraceae cyanobacterium]|nr:hypothetical protein [Prochloraceae cyanobacterium]